MGHLYAGTSGFAYPKWKPDFYPAKLPAKDFLKHYATKLNAVEINYTFRQLPKTTTLESWIGATPEGFSFRAQSSHADHAHLAVEGIRVHRAVFPRHRSAARDAASGSGAVPVAAESQGRFRDARAFLARLPRDIRCAFEFRNNTWLVDEVYRLLEQHGVGLCLAESEKFEVPEVITRASYMCDCGKRTTRQPSGPKSRSGRGVWRRSVTCTFSSSTKILRRGPPTRKSC